MHISLSRQGLLLLLVLVIGLRMHHHHHSTNVVYVLPTVLSLPARPRFRHKRSTCTHRGRIMALCAHAA
ncbi:hypothetical protein DUNSADRAFT_14246 [Dunaliella salina]|uniref:Encoded protein n=1 Tax=Dunaliella salina TaxID=3046 RepID=A0ABQ7G7P3_DUNSA|nr:hypothetical protein DUNSADRAFT_14246 [Dunaliella salina]|eukprot:KAF5830622.1 hypothetical protein DUNSADRAFT_14246 [Dunaliella salina]